MRGGHETDREKHRVKMHGTRGEHSWKGSHLRHETRDRQCKWHEHNGNTENTYRMEKTKTKTQKTLKILKINKCKTINGVTKR